MKEITREKFLEMKKRMIFNDYLDVMRGPRACLPNHTKVSCTTSTAEYYCMGRYSDELDDETAEKMLLAIEETQIMDEESNVFGCIPWFREEKERETFYDTNATFFALMPIGTAYLFCSDKMTAVEKQTIERMFDRAAVFCKKQCKKLFYYSNSVMAFGALLTMSYYFLGKNKEETEEFWTLWNDYADRRGMGWGENSSSGYILHMIHALSVAKLTMPESELKAGLMEKREQLISYAIFHGDKAYVPSIRTQNFTGKVYFGANLYQAMENGNYFGIMAYETNVVLPPLVENRKEEVRKERLFDDNYAYTWIDNGIRLGSVTRFPVMPFCGDGLGWQSMPVCAMIESEDVCYQRLRTVVDGKNRSYPMGVGNEKQGLFDESIYPSHSLCTAQDHNILVAVRGITNLQNKVEAIYEEWFVPGTEREIRELEIGGRKWYLICYPHNAIAVCPLDGVGEGMTKRGTLPTEIIKTDDHITISNQLCKGEEKIRSVAYLESAWIIVVVKDITCAEEYLSKISILDESIHEYEIPRRPTMLRRKITCSDELYTAELEVEPYDTKW